MDSERATKDWPDTLAGYWIEDAEVLCAEANEQERPGHDSLGNPGRVSVVRHAGRLGVRWPRGRVVRRMEEAGLKPVRHTAEETELSAPEARPGALEIDPFLLEKSVVVTVRGRDFPGQQRTLVEAKLETLRRESLDETLAAPRRAAAAKMLADLEEGLRSTMDVRCVVRRFRPAVSVRDPVESVGTCVKVRRGTRIVYRVEPVRREDAADAEAGEPMVFHVVALGAVEAVLLYAGGMHGMRHLRDIEQSRVHHAWFTNRERVKTDATAPWIGRALHQDLVERGSGEIVIHRRRDPEPVTVEKIGRETRVLSVDGAPLEVPVLHCRTACDDDLLVLDDPGNPLLLRLHEAGAEIVRTVEAVLGPATAH
jgi:hypothetical protein